MIRKQLPQFINDMLSSPPSRGGGLHNWIFRTARGLHPYRQPEDIIQLLTTATRGEPIQPNEIQEAVLNSAKCAWKLGQPNTTRGSKPKWPKVNQAQRQAVLAGGGGLVDLMEIFMTRFGGKIPDAEEIIDILFPGNPLLCVAKESRKFATRSREKWRGRIAEMQLIVPSPMTSVTGMTQKGTISERTLNNTGPRRFLVIELDTGSIDEQAAILLHLAKWAPLVLVVHSGGKSLHGWFYCEGRSEEKLKRFMDKAVALGADPATWSRSQLVRIPSGARGNGYSQPVYFFNPEALK